MFLSDGAASYANLSFDSANTANGTFGERFTGYVFNFGRSQNLGDVIYNDVTISPALNANLTIVEKTSGTVSYTVPGNLT
jgi:hypothetical protein